ncbi:MAG: putative DNA-directed DNA polymerase [Prokaryotic dsDNA virus sp.]|nr:MAG: putative DNA-directed DNA polymerase [Prokaryotic dsDNA virus sp.]|tara:strand:- start:11946 stop:13637 length:1692 start_codon:yes stop_codon:yes gene_type:complete
MLEVIKMIISTVDKNNMIGLRWRDENNNRLEKEVSYDEAPPYFFVEQSANKIKKMTVKEHGSSFTIDVNYNEGDYVSLENKKLTKVTWSPPKPFYGKTLKNQFNRTYEADVAYSYRYAVDNIHDMPEYNLRKFYWDLEWQQGGKHDGAITCISYYDSYVDTDNAVIYYWLPKEESMSVDVSSNHKFFPSEKQMLEHFVHVINVKDPDMLISWFGSKFDLPKLIERLHANDIDPRRISPYHDVKGVFFESGKGLKLSNSVKKYSPIEQPIRGRLVLNLDLAFERQWNDSQRGMLPSLALDYVSELVLGTKKLVSEKFPDKNDFFQRGWLEDTQRYLDYAQVDVELLVQIDNSMNTSESVIALQRLLKAPFEACFYASNMGGVYFMRNAWWKAPTGEKGERVNYEGAMIYDPLSEGTNGLHIGVAAFDFAQLYPSMMIARNISWETKSKEPTEFAVNILTPRDFSDVTKEDIRYFKTDKLGLLPKAVLELKALRDEYKRKMKQAETKEEQIKWNSNQLAVKRLMASFYGITAYQGFGWADVDIAASITASAREAIRCAAFKVMEL